MGDSNNFKIHILLLSVAISNALNYSISKIAMSGGIHPMAVILMRIVGTSCFFLILGLFIPSKDKIEPKDYFKLALCSLLGIATNQMLFYNGLHYTKPINAAVMTLMTPIVIFLLSHFILKEKSFWWQFVGVLIAAIGAFLLIQLKGLEFSDNTLIGDLLIIANSTVYAIFMILVTPLMRKYQPVTVMKYIFTFAIPIVFPFTYKHFLQVNWALLSQEVYFSLAFVIIFGTIYNYYINTWSLKHVSPAINGSYIYLIPLLTVAFAILLKQDQLSVLKVVYGLLILLGVYLVNKKQKS